MRELHIDVETFSGADLAESGVYRYVQDPDFALLLIGYSLAGAPERVVDVAQGETLPDELVAALGDPETLKFAYNAIFEMVCLQAAGVLQEVRAEQWRCVMIHSAMVGYPMGLDFAAQIAGIERKAQGGKALVRYFCTPCAPTRGNGMRSRNLPRHDLQKWELFKNYCAKDVRVEKALHSEVSWYQIPQREQLLWEVDYAINATGVAIDRELVEGAIAIDADKTQALITRAREITQLDNPNSVQQLRHWVEQQLGKRVESLDKDKVAEIAVGAPEQVREVLAIRKQLGKTSVSKYAAMASAVCDDSRVRGMLQFMGASRTGRWAGRLVQLHNLPRNHMDGLDIAREAVKSGDCELLDIMYRDVPAVLSQLIRTAFVPEQGKVFYVADFSAIEARVLAWLAGEAWRIDVFASHGKIYEASAAAMFGVPIEEVTKGSDLRQKGKVAELACGYGGGTGALRQMGAAELPEDELERIITQWRNANPAIVRLWADVERAVKDTLKGKSRTVQVRGLIKFGTADGCLVIGLPSGRELIYKDAEVVGSGWRETITYMGSNQLTRKWEKTKTYGGKLVENIVQAIARDCLAEALLSLHSSGYKIVMHVHDEIVIESAPKNGRMETICSVMGRRLPWAPGLVLKAEGFVANYYKKD